jgi:iron-sulfur cluster assembly protein
MSKMMRSTTPSNDSILLSVKRRGCNGLSYVMGYPKVPPSKLDEIVPFTDKHNNQGRLIVDKNAVMSVVGTHLDYIESDMGSEFVFRNPNQKGACGCGESFNV